MYRCSMNIHGPCSPLALSCTFLPLRSAAPAANRLKASIGYQLHILRALLRHPLAGEDLSLTLPLLAEMDVAGGLGEVG